jgi:hypothetical protein
LIVCLRLVGLGGMLRGRRRFAALDFMIYRQALPNLSIALGDARSLYASYPQYDNTVYGRLKVTF